MGHRWSFTAVWWHPVAVTPVHIRSFSLPPWLSVSCFSFLPVFSPNRLYPVACPVLFVVGFLRVCPIQAHYCFYISGSCLVNSSSLVRRTQFEYSGERFCASICWWKPSPQEYLLNEHLTVVHLSICIFLCHPMIYISGVRVDKPHSLFEHAEEFIMARSKPLFISWLFHYTKRTQYIHYFVKLNDN